MHHIFITEVEVVIHHNTIFHVSKTPMAITFLTGMMGSVILILSMENKFQISLNL